MVRLEGFAPSISRPRSERVTKLRYSLLKNGRNGGIRTRDLLAPSQARYSTSLRSGVFRVVNIELTLAVVALIVHATALVIWFRLRAKLEAWVWWVVALGFVIMGIHRIEETFDYNLIPQFSHYSAIGIAIIALFGVVQTKRYLRKQAQHEAALAAVHTKLELLQKDVQNREPIATQIAEIIGDLRSQISFYECQAKDHHLPLYPK